MLGNLIVWSTALGETKKSHCLTKKAKMTKQGLAMGAHIREMSHQTAEEKFSFFLSGSVCRYFRSSVKPGQRCPSFLVHVVIFQLFDVLNAFPY